METPSSMRRVTRSQTLSASNNIPISRKKEESEKLLSRSRKGKIQERSALFDITNDSPIVGLATGSLETPSSDDKSSNGAKQTPGMGEALLRGQVKTLLQRVEEEAVLPKLSFDQPSFPPFHGLLSSPAAALLAPTPANTPFMSDENSGPEISELPSVTSVAKEQDPKINQLTDILQHKTPESPDSPITRALLFDDSPAKSEISDSSDLTFQGSRSHEKAEGDDDSSVWSIQVNASSQGEVEDCEGVFGEVEELEEEIEEYEEDGGLIDELCKGMREACVLEKGGIAEFKGRHTRFIYNSDDEIEGEEEIRKDCSVSPRVLCLKGLPKPEGKHLRFPEEEED